jgi:hypothetical protein
VDFFDHHPDVYDACEYRIQSSVPTAVFSKFVDALGTTTPIPITKDNVNSLLLLAREFADEQLFADCESFRAALPSNGLSVISERLSTLETLFSARLSDARVRECLEIHE